MACRIINTKMALNVKVPKGATEVNLHFDNHVLGEHGPQTNPIIFVRDGSWAPGRKLQIYDTKSFNYWEIKDELSFCSFHTKCPETCTEDDTYSGLYDHDGVPVWVKDRYVWSSCGGEHSKTNPKRKRKHYFMDEEDNEDDDEFSKQEFMYKKKVQKELDKTGTNMHFGEWSACDDDHDEQSMSGKKSAWGIDDGTEPSGSLKKIKQCIVWLYKNLIKSDRKMQYSDTDHVYLHYKTSVNDIDSTSTSESSDEGHIWDID